MGVIVPSEEFCIEVLLNGFTHKVFVVGNNSPVFGFEPSGGLPPEPVTLRVRCETCKGIAKLPFQPPSKAWRRPFVVQRVVHADKV